jgi:uncharacterized repeat protein (TIGR03803 family)
MGNDGAFYGMTESGGTNGTGTLFKVTTTGIRTTLVSFPSSAMSFPSGGLTLAGDGNFYGSTLKDGFSNYGTLFRFSPGSPALTAKVVFTGNPGDQPGTAPNDGSSARRVIYMGWTPREDGSRRGSFSVILWRACSIP